MKQNDCHILHMLLRFLTLRKAEKKAMKFPSLKDFKILKFEPPEEFPGLELSVRAISISWYFQVMSWQYFENYSMG